MTAAQPGSRGSKSFTNGTQPNDAGKEKSVRYWSLQSGLPAGSPIASALVIIVGSLVIAASIVVGFFAFLILSSLLLVLAAVVSIRVWWIRRRMVKDPAFRASPGSGPDHNPRTIEGEYRVVIEDRDRDSR